MNTSEPDEALALADLLVAEPRLSAVGAIPAGRQFMGACGPEDGAGAGWLVVGPAEAMTRSAIIGLTRAAGIVACGGAVASDARGTAARIGLPLLEGVDLRVADVYAAVGRLQRRRPNVRAWRRMAAGEKLQAALLNPSPEAELVRRYAAMTGEAVLVLTVDGDVVTAAGELPARSIARQLRGETSETVKAHLGRWNVWAKHIAVSSAGQAAGLGQWLVRGTRGVAAPDPHGPAAAALEELLNVVAETRRTVVRDELADATVLLTAYRSAESDKEFVEEGLLRRGFRGTRRCGCWCLGSRG